MTNPTIKKIEMPGVDPSNIDIAKILAENGLSHIDISQVKVIKADSPGAVSDIIGDNKPTDT